MIMSALLYSAINLIIVQIVFTLELRLEPGTQVK